MWASPQHCKSKPENLSFNAKAPWGCPHPRPPHDLRETLGTMEGGTTNRKQSIQAQRGFLHPVLPHAVAAAAPAAPHAFLAGRRKPALWRAFGRPSHLEGTNFTSPTVGKCSPWPENPGGWLGSCPWLSVPSVLLSTVRSHRQDRPTCLLLKTALSLSTRLTFHCFLQKMRRRLPHIQIIKLFLLLPLLIKWCLMIVP